MALSGVGLTAMLVMMVILVSNDAYAMPTQNLEPNPAEPS
jgi:hypothetical protein